MLTQLRGDAGMARGSAVEEPRRGEHARGACLRMLAIGDRAAHGQVRVIDHFAQTAHALRGEPEFGTDRLPFSDTTRARDLADQIVQFTHMRVALGRIGDARIRGEIGSAAHAKERDPMVGAVRRHRDEAIARAIDAAAVADQAVVAHWPGRRHEGLSLQMLQQQKRRERLVHRQIDLTADTGGLAPIQSGQHCTRQAQARDFVGDQALHQPRHLLRVGIERSEPRCGLDDVVDRRGIGTCAGRSESGSSAVQDVRSHRGDRLIREPQPIDRLAPHVVDEHVRARDQSCEDALALLALQIDGDRALATIEIEEDRRQPGATATPLMAHDVPLWWLDLDDVGTVVGEYLRGERTEHHAGKVDNAHAGEHRRSGCMR